MELELLVEALLLLLQLLRPHLCRLVDVFVGLVHRGRAHGGQAGRLYGLRGPCLGLLTERADVFAVGNLVAGYLVPALPVSLLARPTAEDVTRNTCENTKARMGG